MQTRKLSNNWSSLNRGTQSGSVQVLPHWPTQNLEPHAAAVDHVPHDWKPGQVTTPWQAAAVAAAALAMRSGFPVAAAAINAASSAVGPVDTPAGAGASCSDDDASSDAVSELGTAHAATNASAHIQIDLFMVTPL